MSRNFLVFLGFILLHSSCLTDLRPKSLAGDGIHRNKNASVTLLRASKAHGYSAWNKMQQYECSIQDTFYGLIGKLASPTKEKSITYHAAFHRISGKGIMEFKTGKNSSSIWTYENGTSYVTKLGIKNKIESKDITFWVPTYQYFIEFPFRIIEASALEMLEDKERDGRTYKRVLASWHTTTKQDAIDQYIVWINDDMIIDYIDFTIRDQAKYLKGSAAYVEYQDVKGIFFPSIIEIYSNVKGKKPLHEITVKDIKLK